MFLPLPSTLVASTLLSHLLLINRGRLMDQAFDSEQAPKVVRAETGIQKNKGWQANETLD